MSADAAELLSALRERIKEQSDQLREKSDEARDSNIILASSFLTESNTLLFVATAISNTLADAARKETKDIQTSILEEHKDDSPGH
jgi:hypothetical protein